MTLASIKKRKSTFRATSCLMTVLVISLAACLILTACSLRERRYELKGRVILVEREKMQLTIAHEKIPGFMNAMTMPFHLKDERAFETISVNDLIRGVLIVKGGRSWLEHIEIISKQSVSMALTTDGMLGGSGNQRN